LTAAVAFFLGATGALVLADLAGTAFADFFAVFFAVVGLIALEVDDLVAFFFETPNAASQPLEYFWFVPIRVIVTVPSTLDSILDMIH